MDLVSPTVTMQPPPQQHGALLANLAEEVLMDILVRLPALSIAQCRAVCRAWRSAISDPSFDAAHARRPPVGARVTAHHVTDFGRPGRDANITLVFDSFGAFRRRWHRDPPGPPPPSINRALRLNLRSAACSSYSVRGSWDGVLCIELTRSSSPPRHDIVAEQYVLWNPFTMACATVCPPEDRAQIIGAYAHPATRRFHLLLASGETDGRQLMAPTIFRLLRVGDAVCREIPLEAQDGQQQQSSEISMPTKTLNCVTLRGSLHWLVLSGSGMLRVLAFDMTHEKLQWIMEAPPNVRKQSPADLITNARLAVLSSAGDLCAFVVDPSTSSMDMWVLDGYASSWRLKERIGLVVQENYYSRSSDLSRNFRESTMVDVAEGAQVGEEIVVHLGNGKIYGCYNLGRKDWQSLNFYCGGFVRYNSLVMHRESVLQHEVSLGEASRPLSLTVSQRGQLTQLSANLVY